jgi:hypothetical protein
MTTWGCVHMRTRRCLGCGLLGHGAYGGALLPSMHPAVPTSCVVSSCECPRCFLPLKHPAIRTDCHAEEPVPRHG